MPSDVQDFYASKTILITGATGFVGQLLISKLLSSCSTLHRIYVLIREKKGKQIEERLKGLFDSPIFEHIKQVQPDYETKVKAIRGDCCENDLGISESDREVLKNEVEIVFHAAATVYFDAPLRESANINVRSLDILIDMAKSMKNLKAFVYTSTAYSATMKTKFVEEKFYEPCLKACGLFSLIDHLDDSVLNEITPILTKQCTNTYMFTKLISEDLCREKGSGLPLCIFRPAGIASCYKEPVKGWINNLYGFIGCAYGYALGIIKVAPGSKSAKIFIVPADYNTNALILSAHHVNRTWEDRSSKESGFDIPIINYTNCSTKFCNTLENTLHTGDKTLEKYPFYNNVVNVPGLITTANLSTYRFLRCILHILPAMIADSVLLILGKKPRFKKLYQKVHNFLDQLAPFTTSNWDFAHGNIDEIWAKLSEEDKQIFYCDIKDLDSDHYTEVFLRGVRLYLNKDTEDNVQKAIKKRKIFRIFYRVVLPTIIFLPCLFLWTRCCSQFIWNYVCNISYLKCASF